MNRSNPIRQAWRSTLALALLMLPLDSPAQLAGIEPSAGGFGLSFGVEGQDYLDSPGETFGRQGESWGRAPGATFGPGGRTWIHSRGATFGPEGQTWIHTPGATFGPDGETWIHSSGATFGPEGRTWIHSSGATFGPGGRTWIHSPGATFGPEGQTWIHTSGTTSGSGGGVFMDSPSASPGLEGQLRGHGSRRAAPVLPAPSVLQPRPAPRSRPLASPRPTISSLEPGQAADRELGRERPSGLLEAGLPRRLPLPAESLTKPRVIRPFSRPVLETIDPYDAMEPDHVRAVEDGIGR